MTRLTPKTQSPDAASVLSARSRAVRAAHSPLGFFVLALLIAEAFLWGAGVWFGLSESWRLNAIGLGQQYYILPKTTKTN